MRRRKETRRTNRRPPSLQRVIAEALEERQLLTLTIDVRAPDGSKSIELINIGQVVFLQVWAEITDPQNQPTEDGLQDVEGSFLGTNVGPGPVAGNLAATLVSPFNYLGSQNGTVQDLNGDGNLDVGSNDNSTSNDFFFARSQFLETSNSGTTVGNTLEFEIGTLTYTVTHLNYGGETDINFRPRGTPESGFTAVWNEDGQGVNNTTGTFTAGAPFVVTAPPAKLVITAEPNSTTAGSDIDSPSGVQVSIEDAAGNLITSSDNITVSLAANPGSDILHGTLTQPAVNGIATFPDLFLTKVANGYSFTAADSTVAGIAAVTSSTFNITVAAASQLVFTTQPASMTVGATVDAPNGITVAVEDSFGNVVTSNNDNISLSLSPNSSALTGTTSSQASSGVASFNTLSVSAVGANYTFTATDATNSVVAAATSQPFNANSSSLYNFQSLTTMNAYASLTGGFIPQGSVYIDNNGNIFGTTTHGGPYGYGTLFEIAEPSGVYSTLISFTGTGSAYPGADPEAGLISDGNGNLFGTTSSGGLSNDGTVFELAGPSHTFSSVLSFTGTAGAYPGASPQAALNSDGNGNLFGTTANGGASNDGTVFELAGSSHTFSSLVSFTGTSGTYPGSSPQGNLTSDGNGNLLGTTAQGGPSNSGTVFELAGSSYTFSTVHTFTFSDGEFPLSGLTSDGNGNLFGTTERGGSSAAGDIFELAGTSHTFSTVISFTGNNGPYPAFGPVTALASDGNGNLFGVTTPGNDMFTPSVFELAGPAHTFSTVYSFNGETDSGFQVSLASDSNGNLFGTENPGGSFGFGSVFELPASSRSTPTTLYSFSDGMGWNPMGSVVIDSSGNVLGTTSSGGVYGDGTVFEIAEPSGVYSTLFSFSGNSGPYPGGDPQAGLISDGNGNLFGTTAIGGSSGDGTVFELAGPSHTFSSLVSFTGSGGHDPGTNPEVSLTPDGNGNLFGTTNAGGASGDGTVFELAGPNHTFSSLVSFTGYSGLYPGNEIYAPLTSGGNGNIFGLTDQGGSSGYGTVFELAGPSHTFSSLLSFTGTSGAYPGIGALASLTSDGNGNLIGSTQGGGTASDGTVFELTGPSYTYSLLFSFSGTSGAYLGASPTADLTSDGNGNLLGMTQEGGTSNAGTIFELAGPSHTFSTLLSFNTGSGPYPGINPRYGLTPDGSGNLFGVTAATAFELVGPSHTFSLLFPFTGTSGPYPVFGANALTSDGHGDLFDASEFGGGPADNGTVFEIALSSKLAFAGSPSGATAGATLSPIQVNVEQSIGSIAAGDSSIITLSIQSGPAGATLGGTTSVQAVNGVATFNNLTLNIAGNYTLVATDGTLPPVISNPFTIQPTTVTWTGAAGDLNWANPGNWSDDFVPTANTNATIPSGFTVQISSGTYSVDSLTTSSPIEITSAATLLLYGPSTFASSLTIDNGGTLKVAADPVLLILNGSDFTDNGTLDLGDSDMIIHNGNITQIAPQIGHQIISSLASNATTLAIELNDDGTPAHNPLMTTFDNQPVTNTDVLVKFTYYGDTNLDGSVTAADYLAIDNAFSFNATNPTTPLTGWNNGDFNYDGVINGDDYTLIDNAFNSQSTVPLISQAQAIASPNPIVPQATALKRVTTPPAIAQSDSSSLIWPFDFNPLDKRKPSLANEIFTD